MEPLPYESSRVPESLEITVSPEATVILVPPLSAARYTMRVVGATLGLLVSGACVVPPAYHLITTGWNWSHALSLPVFLCIVVLSTLVFITTIADRHPVHSFHVTADELSAVRTSGQRRTVGQWRKDELLAVVAHLGPRLATGRHETYLDVRHKGPPAATTELLHGHPIADLRQIADAIEQRMGLRGER